MRIILIGGRWMTALLLAFGPVASLAGQEIPADDGLRERSLVGVGYVVNAPDQILGFGAMTLGTVAGGWGVYADAKFTASSRAGETSFEGSLTAEQAENQFGDLPFTEDSSWTTVNLAVVRAATDDLALYAGGGFSRETAYGEYLDEDQERGVGGFYWVEDPRDSGDRLNLLGGAFLRAGETVLFQFGVESSPTGFTAGVLFAF